MIKASVIMITYGHEKFIEQAINEVLMQEGDFEVELIIANDCSPDQTDAIIRNILENHPRASSIKYINHDKNLGIMPNFLFAMKEYNDKYIALCDGDDYWSDPLNLQKNKLIFWREMKNTVSVFIMSNSKIHYMSIKLLLFRGLVLIEF